MARGILTVAAIASIVVFPSHGQEAAKVPDFSGLWARMTFGAEPPRKGAGPLVNLIRRGDGASDGSMLVGDYTNPILKPSAAARVRALGDISRTGAAFPDPSNQCAPQSVPFILRQQEIQLLQEKDRVTILYMLDHHVRHVRLNATHPGKVTPSWSGDSVGHYEGDTLIVDTIGIKVGPVTMSDQFGSPQTDAMHVIERYRLVDSATALAVSARNESEYGRADGANANGVFVDFMDRGRGLQHEFSVDDPGVFTAPWSAAVTYRKAGSQWQEQVCAENDFEYYAGKSTTIPAATKSDF